MDDSSSPPLAQCSITWHGFTELLQRLNIPALDIREFPLRPFNTHQLRPLLLARGIYPARDYPDLVVKRLPDLFVTYNWWDSILAVRDTVTLAIQHCLGTQARTFPNVDLDLVLRYDVTFWIDWVFLDQSSRDVDRELDEILPSLFNDGCVHVVASTTALSRAWCCYELAQFNRHMALTPGADLTSLMPGDLQSFPLWAGVASTDQSDKLKVEKRIVDLFPGGLYALENLMVQAGLAADLRGQGSAAIERMRSASARWIARSEGPQ